MKSQEKVLEVKPLQEAKPIGEEAEVYGYGCGNDCGHWANSSDPHTPGCYRVTSCFWLCWW